MKRSKEIILVFIGTALALAGYSSCDRDDRYSTTQPSYGHGYSHGYSGYRSSSGSRSTSRGGFGEHGHGGT